MRCTMPVCLVLVMAAGSAAYGQDDDPYRDGTLWGVRQDSVAAFSLVGFAGGQFRPLNSEGHAPVPVSTFDDPVFYSIGKNTAPTEAQEDIVEVAWYEMVNPQGQFIQVIMRTRNGKQLVPLGTTKDGHTVQAFSYALGGEGNGVDWRDAITFVGWNEFVVSYSADGGQTAYSDPAIQDPIGGQHWSGIDLNYFPLEVPGAGVNWMQMNYKVTVVPAPAPLACLALAAGALAVRRRR